MGCSRCAATRPARCYRLTQRKPTYYAAVLAGATNAPGAAGSAAHPQRAGEAAWYQAAPGGTEVHGHRLRHARPRACPLCSPRRGRKRERRSEAEFNRADVERVLAKVESRAFQSAPSSRRSRTRFDWVCGCASSAGVPGDARDAIAPGWESVRTCDSANARQLACQRGLAQAKCNLAAPRAGNIPLQREYQRIPEGAGVMLPLALP